jgi:hypothetical protein
MKYWEIIANRLAKRGWSLGWAIIVSPTQAKCFTVDAHRVDSRRLIVRSDELLSALLELESETKRFGGW